MRHATLVCAIGLFMVAQPISAQTFGVAVGTGYYAGIGTDYDDTSGGILLDGRLFYRSGGAFELDVGASHAAFTVGEIGLKVDTPHWEVYAEPRFNFSAGSASPFLGVRGGWTRESFSALGLSATTSGYLVGGVAGVNVPLGGAADLELSGLAGYVSYSAWTSGGVWQGSGGKGAVLGVRVGLRFAFPASTAP